MSSAVLKAAGMAWLRFGKKMPLVCSEVGRWNADVLGLDQAQSIEIEVKTSRSDIKADFKNKIAKHWTYGHTSGAGFVPNRFYFLVPERLVGDATEIIEGHNPKIGVLSFSGDMDFPVAWSRDIIAVRKKGLALHSAPPSKQLMAAALYRMGSELCGLRLKEAIHNKRLIDHLEKSQAEFSALLARSAGTLDAEQPIEDLDIRAKELADAVHHPGHFASLDLNGKKAWLEAAVRVMEGEQKKGWIDAANLF